MLEEEGRSLGHRLSAALRIQMSQFRARTTQHTCCPSVPVITSPVRTPSPVITHTVRVCALRKRQRQRREQENERDRPTERTAPGWAGQSRSRYRAQACAAGSSYVRVYYMHAALPPVARGPCTHARVRLVIHTPDDPPIKQCFFFELARSLSRRENEHKQTQTLGRGSLGSWIDEDRS